MCVFFLVRVRLRVCVCVCVGVCVCFVCFSHYVLSSCHHHHVASCLSFSFVEMLHTHTFSSLVSFCRKEERRVGFIGGRYIYIYFLKAMKMECPSWILRLYQFGILCLAATKVLKGWRLFFGWLCHRMRSKIICDDQRSFPTKKSQRCLFWFLRAISFGVLQWNRDMIILLLYSLGFSSFFLHLFI